MLPGKNARMSRTRSSDFPAKQLGTRIGRYFAAVLRTKVSVSRILPGKTTVPEGSPDGASTGLYLAANEDLRNVTSRAHLGSVCGEARIAFVSVRLQVSSQALWLHHHAALKQGLRIANKSESGTMKIIIRRVLIRRRSHLRRAWIFWKDGC
jgi:hypothetical protein